jgi:hypothetical protein
MSETKIICLNDLINELEYEMSQGIYTGDMAVNMKAYIQQLKEQVNGLSNQLNK